MTFARSWPFVSLLWLKSHFHNRCSLNRGPNALGACWPDDFQRAFRSGPYYRVQLPYKVQSPKTYHFLSNAVSEKRSLAITLCIFINNCFFSPSEAGFLKADPSSIGDQLQRLEIHFYIWMTENQIWRDRKHYILQSDLIVGICKIWLNFNSPYLWERCGQKHCNGGMQKEGWCSQIAQHEVLGKSLTYQKQMSANIF